MCNLEKDKLFTQLHEDYYEVKDEKAKLNLRNAILTSLIPLLEISVNQWEKISDATREDLFQDLLECAILKYIPKWKPTGKSISAYYKRCFFTTSLNWLKARRVWSDKEILIDSESYYWEANGEEDVEEVSFQSDFKFEDKNTQMVYTLVLELMQEGSLTDTITPFVTFFRKYLATVEKDINSEYYETAIAAKELSVRELRKIYSHALITCRDHYLEMASNVDQEIDLESFFGRMGSYLDKKQTQKIIKVFGGTTIKVPKWEDGRK